MAASTIRVHHRAGFPSVEGGRILEWRMMERRRGSSPEAVDTFRGAHLPCLLFFHLLHLHPAGNGPRQTRSRVLVVATIWPQQHLSLFSSVGVQSTPARHHSVAEAPLGIERFLPRPVRKTAKSPARQFCQMARSKPASARMPQPPATTVGQPETPWALLDVHVPSPSVDIYPSHLPHHRGTPARHWRTGCGSRGFGIPCSNLERRTVAPHHRASCAFAPGQEDRVRKGGFTR